ncbi:TPA: RecE family exodeoxyribonuclease [Salmonella enterica]
MKNIKQMVFYAKKSIQKLRGIIAGTIWFDNDDQDEIDALSTLAIKKAGFKRSDFFKPVRVDHLVVDDMPAEGVFDTAFCDRYKLAEDGKSWLLPAAQPESGDSDTTDTSNQGQGNEDATSITDSGDTASTAVTGSDTATTTDETNSSTSTGTVADDADAGSASEEKKLPAYEYNVNGESMAEVLKEADVGVATLPFIPRFLHIWYFATGEGTDWKELHWASADQRRSVARAEMDQDDKYIQNLLPVIRAIPELDKLNNYNLSNLTEAIQTVFPPLESVPQSYEFKNLVAAWREAEPIDRGLLVKEWAKGNRISRVETSPVTCNTTDPQTQKETQKTEVSVTLDEERPRRSEKPTFRTINYELACGFYEDLDLHNLRPAMDFAKRIIDEDREDWKRMSATVGIIPDIKEFDRQTIIDLVRKAPAAVHSGSPELRRTWCESFLAVHGVRDPDWYEYVPDGTSTTHEENTKRIRQAAKCLRDIEAGKINDEEKPQPTPTGELADEPATPAPEAVEQDTTEHHPDPQPLTLENEPPVSQTEAGYQKIRAELHEARKNIPPKNPVDVGKQLAAARGEFIEGISDPSDPKWVHNDYSASNEGKKTEVDADDAADTADSADHSEEFSNQTEPETSHSEPSADQIEPETPENKPESQKPEPVTKVADGVLDVSVFFADTSNQGEKAEITPLNTEQAADSSQDSESDRSLTPEPEPGTMLEILLLLRKISRDLRHIVDINQQTLDSIQLMLGGYLRAEEAHRKAVAAIGSALAMTYATKTEEGTEHGE